MVLFVNGMVTALLIVLAVQQVVFVGLRTTRDWATISILVGLTAFFISPFYVTTPFLWAGVPFVVSVPISFYVLAKSLFTEDYQVARYSLPLYGLCVAFCTYAFIVHPTPSLAWDSYFMLSRALLIIFLGLGFWECIKDWRDDLLNARRGLRSILISSFGLILFVHFITDIGAGFVDPFVMTATALGFSITLGIVCLYLFYLPKESLNPLLSQADEQADAETQNEEKEQVLYEPETKTQEHRNKSIERDLARLQQLMEDEQLYRQHGLTISELAKHIGMREHQLRKLINENLGYRNFNEYLGKYRLTEVENKLNDRTQDLIPILTLALDAGYKSINPFNRAFKARYHMTPSEFRGRSKIGNTG